MHELGRRSVWLLAPALLFAAGLGCTYDFDKYSSTVSAAQHGVPGEPSGGDAMPDNGASEPPDAASPATFYRAINVGGSDATALMIDGNNWEAGSTAPDVTFSGTGGGTMAVTDVPLMPPTDADRTSMIEHFLSGRPIKFTMNNVPSGSYLVYIYTWGNSGPQMFNVLVQNKVVLPNYNSGPSGHWQKLGPWPVDVTSGSISITTSPNMGMAVANLCGVEIWQQ